MIVTDVGGLKSTIGDTGTGIVAEEAEPECIRKEIVSFFSHPEEREGFIDRIRSEKRRLSWSAFCDILRTFAESL